MTKEDLVRVAVEAAGEALEKLFPGVEFHITAKAKNGQVDQHEPAGAEALADKSAFFGNLIGISRLMEAVEEKAPQALKTAAAKVSMYRNMCGELTAACAEPASQDEPEDQIDEMLKYTMAFACAAHAMVTTTVRSAKAATFVRLPTMSIWITWSTSVSEMI